MRAKAMIEVYPLPVTHSTDVTPFCPFRPKGMVRGWIRFPLDTGRYACHRVGNQSLGGYWGKKGFGRQCYYQSGHGGARGYLCLPKLRRL